MSTDEEEEEEEALLVSVFCFASCFVVFAVLPFRVALVDSFVSGFFLMKENSVVCFFGFGTPPSGLLEAEEEPEDISEGEVLNGCMESVSGAEQLLVFAADTAAGSALVDSFASGFFSIKENIASHVNTFPLMVFVVFDVDRFL